MADYFSPTVIQQLIPIADMTALEHLVLKHIFDEERDGEKVYFHASMGPNKTIWVSLNELRSAFYASANIDSTTTAYIDKHLATAPIDDSDTKIKIEIDFSGTSWEFIFQDIIRRSATLPYITAVTSFTCSKMRPDGFGGMAVLITADSIMGKSTYDILLDFLAEKEENSEINHENP